MENKNEDFDMQVNMNFFANSVIDLCNLLLKKSGEAVLEQNKKKFDRHEGLRKSCNTLKNGFSDQMNSGIDSGKIIKKVYKTLTANLDYLHPQEKQELFFLKDNNEIVTIFPGVDIGLVVHSISKDERKVLWGNILMAYISATNMISAFNKKKDEKVWSILPQLQKKVVDYGIIQNSLFFNNPFVGINNQTGKYDVNTMFSNLNKNQETAQELPGEMNPDNMLKMVGMDKLFDMKKLSTQLKDIKTSDIEEATNNVSKILGAEKDSETNKLLESLVNGVVNKLKAGGDNLDMFSLAKSVAKETEQTVDPKKLKGVAGHFTNFMNNSTNMLKNVKDEKGNPIGEQLFNSMKIPLQFMQGMNGMNGTQQNKK